MATFLTIMFPDEKGIELTIRFENDNRLRVGVELQTICLAGQKDDFSSWLSESAIELIECMIKHDIESTLLCRIAVEYEDAA